jgi:glycosyltransferase involved in cell wall biosynthesis
MKSQYQGLEIPVSRSIFSLTKEFSIQSPTQPLVSIGIPIRNGQKFIREGLESILAQSMTDFEVVICDNASTDTTEAICNEFAQRDRRVRYFRNERNLGPAGNHNRCVERAAGKYFRWQAHDDLLAPTYLEKTVDVMEKDSTIANCHSWTKRISEDGSFYGDYKFVIGTDNPSLPIRFSRLVNVRHRDHLEYEIFGLWHREQMIRTRLQSPCAHGDRVHLVRMILFGRFYEVPEYLFIAREHSGQSLALTTRRSRFLNFLGTGPIPPAEWWDPALKDKATFPEWNLLKEYWNMLDEVPIDPNDRAACRRIVARWAVRNAHKLGRDVAFGVETALRKLASFSPTTSKPQSVA